MRYLGNILVALTAASALAQQAVQIEAGIAGYAKKEPVSGKLSSVGSDTMNNVMTLWIEGFSKIHPQVQGQVEGKGSTTAPPALIEGLAQLGPMSRPMKAEERDKFEAKFGYKPTEVKTSVDALAVYVHKDNPLKGLNFVQVDAVFSKTRKQAAAVAGTWGAAGEDITTWGQLGVKGEWASRPISLYGRNSASGTYGYFKEHALAKGDYKDTVKEQPGSAAVVQGVESDKFAMGYSGIGYKTSGVRALPLAPKDGTSYKEATNENCLDGSYPLSRYLYLYVNKDPRKPMDPLVKEFLRFVLSKEGQEVVIKDGYLPLPAKVVEAELKKLE